MKFVLLVSSIFCLNLHASISISTFNIRNFNSKTTNLQLLKETMAQTESDIWAIQEIVDEKGFYSFLQGHMPEYQLVISSCGGGGGQKLGFLFNRARIKLKKVEVDSDFENKKNSCGPLRPAVIGTFTHLESNETYKVVALHLKAGSGSRNYSRRWKQYKKLVKLFNRIKSKSDHLILAGDFNTTGYLDRNTDFQQFQRMLEDINGISVSEQLGCTSYWSGANRRDDIEEPSLLDHILVTGSLKSRIKSIKLGSHCGRIGCRRSYSQDLGPTYQEVSDHCPGRVSFE